jgi:hypothetical protein
MKVKKKIKKYSSKALIINKIPNMSKKKKSKQTHLILKKIYKFKYKNLKINLKKLKKNIYKKNK